MCLFASFCTQEIDSTPPATIDLAFARDDALRGQRDGLQPGRTEAVDGHARDRHRAARAQRDLARDVGPGRALGNAQPMSTSSTSAGSSLARSMACLTACPPIVAPWVMLNAPRQDLAKPGARGGNDDGVGHDGWLSRFDTCSRVASAQAAALKVLPSAASRASSAAGCQKAASPPGCAAKRSMLRTTL